MAEKTQDDAAEPVSLEDLFEDLKAVVRDAEELLKATEGQAGEKMAEIRARAEQSLGNARERLRAAGTDAGARASTAARATDAYVRENPWAAVAVAAGLGFLLGSVGRRR